VKVITKKHYGDVRNNADGIDLEVNIGKRGTLIFSGAKKEGTSRKASSCGFLLATCLVIWGKNKGEWEGEFAEIFPSKHAKGPKGCKGMWRRYHSIHNGEFSGQSWGFQVGGRGRQVLRSPTRKKETPFQARQLWKGDMKCRN